MHIGGGREAIGVSNFEKGRSSSAVSNTLYLTVKHSNRMVKYFIYTLLLLFSEYLLFWGHAPRPPSKSSYVTHGDDAECTL